jgi:serine/threonine protein phosphatase PrpC
MTTARLRAAGDTHAGLQRDNNEDRFFFDDRRGVFCVIDGVGGQLAGERAAEIAADTIRARLVSSNNNGASGPTAASAALRDAFTAANQAILDAASRDRTLNGMACVATVAVADGERLRFGHVGDTRLFKIRDGSITKLTHDHSPVGELEDSGALTEGEAMRHPRRNEIYRDLGSQPRQPDDPAFVEVGEAAFERDAALVLCSDGLSDLVSSGSVRRIVEAHAGAPALAVQELITAANDAGGKDNVTVLVVEGDQFASAVAARGSRRGRTGTMTTPNHPSSTPTSMPVRSPLRTGLLVSITLAAGLVLGSMGLLVAMAYGWSPVALMNRVGLGAVDATKTWRVGLESDADFATINEALARAGSSDTIRVGPGEYREALRIDKGVTLIGEEGTVLRPPLGSPADWTAVTLKTPHARPITLRGIRIVASQEERMGTAIAVEGSQVELEDLEISGAGTAGVDFRDGARGALRRSFVHRNGGSGVVVRAGAEPRVEFNVILHNGSGSSAGAPGVLVEPGGRPALANNGIGHNGGPAVSGLPTAELVELGKQNVLSPPPAVVTLTPPAAPRRTTPRTRPPA